MRELTKDECEFTLTVESDDTPIRGNCSAIDEETDRENEQWVIDQLNSGNDYAWCEIIVTCKPKHEKLNHYKGIDSLWGISARNYKEIEELARDHGMESEALAYLNDNIRNSIEKSKEVVEVLAE